MLMEAKKNLRLIAMYFKFNLSAAMEYRGSFLIQTFGMILNNSAFIYFWWILFSNIDSIGGYGFREVMIIWSISSSAYGLGLIFFGNSIKLSNMIAKGELDSYLLQPKDVLINIIASGTIVSAWGDLFYGLILFTIVNGFNPIHTLLFLLFCVTGALVITSILIITNTLAFFIGDAQGITSLITEFLITFSIYPEGIYSGFTKLIIFTIIPAAFISHIPVRLINSFNPQLFLLLLAAVVAWLLFTYLFFKWGLKRYESGNLIVNKL